MIRRLRARRIINRHRHLHWDGEGFLSGHAHMHEQVHHEHNYDAPCELPECEPFRLHRVHPQPVVPMEETIKYGGSKFGGEL